MRVPIRSSDLGEGMVGRDGNVRDCDPDARLPALELQQVCKSFAAVHAVKNVSLTVTKGEFVTLLGPSGSGKTTLLNLLAGTLTPTSGRIRINGRDATEIPPGKRGIGMVFQNYALMPHMTVFDNIAFPLRVRNVAIAEIRRRVGDVLELIQMPDAGERKPRQLSGGQQQRVSLARCIVYNPALILMDEPLGALDRKLRDQMQLEIKRLHMRLGITMLYVTHDQDEALAMSDRIALLNQGAVEQIGTPDELYFHPATVFAAQFLGHSNLFAGRITELGRFVELGSDAGMLRALAPRFDVALGDELTAMVRPENLNVVVDGESATGMNRVEATTLDSVVLGSIVRHHLQLHGGQSVAIIELNRGSRMRSVPGQRVSVTWRPEDTFLLRRSEPPGR